jgi:hypothetical protein
VTLPLAGVTLTRFLLCGGVATLTTALHVKCPTLLRAYWTFVQIPSEVQSAGCRKLVTKLVIGGTYRLDLQGRISRVRYRICVKEKLSM